MQRVLKPMFQTALRLYHVRYRTVYGYWISAHVHAHCPGSALRHVRESVSTHCSGFHIAPSSAPMPDGGVERVLTYG